MSNLPTGTVTFLFTDIEGSTKRWEQYPQAMSVALARHDDILRQAIEANGGYVFKTVGDAFCAAFPTALDPFVCTRYELGDFAREALDLGVTYLGVCCGAGPHHIRALAEAVGRTPAASRYTADMSKHAFLGSDPSLRPENQGYAEKL